MKFVSIFAMCLMAMPAFANNHIAQLARQLNVQYELVDSKPVICPKQQEKCYYSKLHLSYPTDFTVTDFAIYFSQLMPIYAVEGNQFTITHINGDLHKLMPSEQFKGFSANQTVEIGFYTKDSQITRSEFMPNYLVTNISDNTGEQALVIDSTKTHIDPATLLETQPYLLPFTGLNQLQTSKHDNTAFADAAYLYRTVQKPSLTHAPLGLIPKPQQLTQLSNKVIDLSKGVYLTPTTVPLAGIDMALQRLEKLKVPRSNAGTPITLEIDNTLSNEAYTLSVKQHAITIRAASASGFFYAITSLAGLISIDNQQLPELLIDDAPAFSFRGVHLDLARNFRSMAFLKQTIEQMAAYKLNKLHLHLADDEGWRIAVRDLPELTEIASKRCLDLTETRCLLPQLGAGNDPHAQNNGFLSSTDYIHLLQYAAHHHIEVIPSLDMPGHSRAAIKAMDARFKRLTEKGEHAKAKHYLLSEQTDKTQYSSIQHYSDNTLNVCLPATYRFVEKVVDELQWLHHQAGTPLKTYHIGADETAGAWVKSPACIALKKQQPNVQTLNGYFIEQVSQMLAKKGLTVAAWSDGLSDTDPSNMPAKVQSNVWSMLSDNGHHVANTHANTGWDVVLSTPEVTYFDFPYQSHPHERGNHWASRAIDEYKVFSFMPHKLAMHAEFWRDVNNNAYEADNTQHTLNTNKHYSGLQAHLWGEMIRSDNQASYMLYPRLLALAERAWHVPSWQHGSYPNKVYSQHSNNFTQATEKQNDWQRFAALLGYKEIGKLAAQGVFYRIPTVAAQIENNALNAFTPYPGFVIEYQDALGNWHNYNHQQKPKSAQAIRAYHPSSTRKGRTLPLL